MAGDGNVKECTICGDIGFSSELFRCPRCMYRLQHRYCSSLYYNPDSGCTENPICEWCLREELETSRSVPAKLCNANMAESSFCRKSELVPAVPDKKPKHPDAGGSIAAKKRVYYSAENKNKHNKHGYRPPKSFAESGLGSMKRQRSDCSVPDRCSGGVNVGGDKTTVGPEASNSGRSHVTAGRGITRRYKLLAEVLQVV